VEPHPFFQRNGQDLEVNLPVSILEAAQGARVDIPTPKGTISMKVPPKSSTGKRLRIKGHGVPSQSGTPGDLYAIVHVMLPESVDEDSLELLRKFDERNPSNPRASLRW
jgi:DnaJ-class molecular chaperone